MHMQREKEVAWGGDTFMHMQREKEVAWGVGTHLHAHAEGERKSDEEEQEGERGENESADSWTLRISYMEEKKYINKTYQDET